MTQRLPGALAARNELIRSTLSFLEELSKDAGGNPPLQLALATAYSKLGDVQGDIDASNVGDMAGALHSYRAAAALLGDPRADPDRLVLWAELQDKIGKTLPDAGDRDGAQQLLHHAITVVEPSRSLTPANAVRLRARLYLSLSRATFELPQALAFAHQSLSAAERAAHLAPDDPSHHGDTDGIRP